MKKIIFFFAFVVAVSAVAQNRQIEFEHGPWAEIIAKAKKESKLIMLDAYAVWCGPCKWMAKNVFTKDEVADFYNATFVNAKIDMEKGEGIELAKKYGVQAYPTFLFINGDGEIVHRICGSNEAPQFIQWGKDAYTPEKQLATAKKKFMANKKDGTFAISYFAMLEAACANVGPEAIAYLAEQPESELTSRANWTVINQYLNDYKSKEFNYLLNNREQYSKLYSKDSVENKVVSVYAMALNMAIRKQDETMRKQLIEDVKKSGLQKAGRIILESDMNYSQQQKEWANYAKTADAYVEQFAMNDAQTLNSTSWTFYEQVTDKKMLEKASNWSKRSVEIENNYAYNDTYASLLFKLGKKRDAEKVAKTAIEIGEKNGEDVSETKKLLEKIKASK